MNSGNTKFPSPLSSIDMLNENPLWDELNVQKRGQYVKKKIGIFPYYGQLLSLRGTEEERPVFKRLIPGVYVSVKEYGGHPLPFCCLLNSLQVFSPALHPLHTVEERI